MLPQSSPSGSPPPSSEAAPRSRRWGYGIWIVGVLAILLMVITFFHYVMEQRRKAILTSAISNQRALGFALYEFDREYGKFPDADTAVLVKAKSETLLSLGTTTSNDYFRQLIASGILLSEVPFYADIKGSREPDYRMDAAHALEKGECGYSYVVGVSSEANPSTPICLTPMVPGTDRFDPIPFGNRAAVLKIDNSVNSYPIDTQGHVIMHRQNLLDPANGIWDGKPPVIVWPE